MSEQRAIPDEERPFVPEEEVPATESTDFDAEPVQGDAPVLDDDPETAVGNEMMSEEETSDER